MYVQASVQTTPGSTAADRIQPDDEYATISSEHAEYFRLAGIKNVRGMKMPQTANEANSAIDKVEPVEKGASIL
jgi:hypothetical protein